METPPFCTMKIVYVYVLITAFLFGSMEVACKIGGTEFDELQLTFLRFAIGGLVLLPFALRELKQRSYRLSLKDILQLAAVGTLGIPVSMVMFQLSIMASNASTVAVLICTSPFFTMVFAHLFTEEKLTRHKLIVLAIALAGIFFMFRPWDIQEGNTIYGMVLMLLAALFFGAYTIAGKVCVKRMGLMAQTSFSFLLGSFVLLLIILITGRPVVAGVVEHLPIVLYVGVFVTGVGYYCYFKAIEMSDAATGSFAFFLKPAIAPVLAAIFLHETILWNTYVGIALILCASLLNILHQKEAAHQQRVEDLRRSGGDQIRKALTMDDPIPENDFRHYAVLIPLIEGEEGIRVLYEVRAADLDRQPGEICFPGGQVEPGETYGECALRETEEEIGIPREKIELLDELTVIYGVGRFAMHCFPGMIAKETADKMNISRDEVGEVFTVALEDLMNTEPEIYRAELIQKGPEDFPYEKITGESSYDWSRLTSPVPVYDVDGRMIWGLTGRATKVLVETLKERGEGSLEEGTDGSPGDENKEETR